MKQVLRGLSLKAKKNSPAILTGMAIMGVMTTTVMAVRATPKALELVSAEREFVEYKNQELTKKDILKVTWRVYAPAVVMGVATVSCILGANYVNARRNLAIAGLYSLSETSFKEYQKKVIEKIGEKKDKEIREEVIQEKLIRNPIEEAEVYFTGKGEILCFDDLTGRYFRSEVETIRQVINTLNHNMRQSMWVQLNDLYYELGIPTVSLGEDIGWDVDNPIDVVFTSKLTSKNEPCLVVQFSPLPCAAFLS